jgi:hypothetical protein
VDLDLVIFDTTCFSPGSGRISRALSWARDANVPIVLVRSHTKLDSLEIEYGRLGSAVFVSWEQRSHRGEWLDCLANDMRTAVRLFGGAAIPAHFPPFVGTDTYRTLTAKRIAAILRNSRRTAHRFAGTLACDAVELRFPHGLYLTIAPRKKLDETQTRELVAGMCRDLRKAELPLRHAGSFGFDFGAAEWFQDTIRDRYVVRIAVPDLPTRLWDQVTGAVVEWWAAHAA